MRLGFASVMVRDGGQSLKVDTLSSRLDRALGEMCLFASQRNCTYLLDALKAVSGRLALRLAGTGNAVQAMIAVALAQRHCARAGSDEPAWLSLAEGFLIPLDDVPELFREPGKLVEGGEQRADLLYVSATKKGGLRLTFVEVKFRRYLKTARAADLAEGMERQIAASCSRWGQLFGTRTSALEDRQPRLARAHPTLLCPQGPSSWAVGGGVHYRHAGDRPGGAEGFGTPRSSGDQADRVCLLPRVWRAPAGADRARRRGEPVAVRAGYPAGAAGGLHG